MCLEFSKVEQEPIKTLYQQYNAHFLPFVGGMVAKDSSSYQYLAESIDRFYSQQELLDMINKVGFQYSNYRNLSFGIVAIHSGFKL